MISSSLRLDEIIWGLEKAFPDLSKPAKPAKPVNPEAWASAFKSSKAIDADSGKPLEEVSITLELPKKDSTKEEDGKGGPIVGVVGTPSGNKIQSKGLPPGTKVTVKAKCHQTRTYIVGQDDPPSGGVKLKKNPLKVWVEGTLDPGWKESLVKRLAKDGYMVTNLDTIKAKPAGLEHGGLSTMTVTIPDYESKKCPAGTLTPGRLEGSGKSGSGKPGGSGERAFVPTKTKEVNVIEYPLPRKGQGGGDIVLEQFPCDPFFHSKGSWDQPYDDQWALKRIGFLPMPRGTTGSLWPKKGKPVLVAVIDTGLDVLHLDLLGRVWVNRDEVPFNGKDDDGNGYVDDVRGWNFVDDSPDITDNNGHGTVISGIIAGNVDNGFGIAGVNPWAVIMPVKATDFDNKGTSFTVAQALVYAVDKGARIVNISICGEGRAQIEEAAIRKATEKGVLVIVAAGNDGKNTKDYGPSGVPGVITVASTDLNDRRVGFSNWGKEVDVAAPGVDVLSLRADRTDLLVHEKDDYESGSAIVGKDRLCYRVAGTSFSVPLVTGVASLILSTRPELTAEQVRRMILQSARDIDEPGYDQYSGYGLLDAKAALAADPEFFIEAAIAGVRVAKKGRKQVLEVGGTAEADRFGRAWLELGKGDKTDSWKKVGKPLRRGVRNGILGEISPTEFAGARKWTLRLVVQHRNDREREARFVVNLGG